MHLIEVKDPQTVREFLEFPVSLYQNHPHWIRPLNQDIEAVFDREKNLNFRHGEAIRWVLRDQQHRPIGRVAAFVNDDTRDASTQPTGGMGFFECVDEQGAAFRLFDACRAWLEERGLEAMDGPINFGERDKWWGLLVEGFTAPNYGMFYHLPYYRQLFEAYGFREYFKQYTYHRKVSDVLSPKLLERADRILQDPHYRLAHAQKKDLDKLAADFFEVYRRAWANHAEVSQASLPKIRAMIGQMKPVMEQEIIWFAYHDGEPVGFFAMLPELNQIFRHVNGKLDLLGKLRFLWHRRRLRRQKDNKKVFGIIFGVVPEHQAKGVETALMAEARQALLDRHYTDIEMNWIGDFNPKMMAVLRSIGARICKTHITYRKLFDESKPFERYPVIR
jgi:GNAT superfamily N-acetyltransferase